MHRKTVSVALLLLLSACSGGAGTLPARDVIPGAMNAPEVIAAQATTRTTLTKAVRGIAGGWRAKVEYRDRLDRPDLVAMASRNAETARLSAATLQRSFGTGGLRPYVGLGLAQNPSRVDGVGEDDAYALQGVVGGDMVFTEAVRGFVQYHHAFASGDEGPVARRREHGMRFGLSVSLN